MTVDRGAGVAETGDKGRSVLSGAGAPEADQGNPGDFYIATGANEIYGPKTTDELTPWGDPTSLVGPRGPAGDKGDTGLTGADCAQGLQGATGAAGSTILTGPGLPTTVGAPGDFYIDTTDYQMYGPKTVDGWPETGFSLKGIKGRPVPSGPLVLPDRTARSSSAG